MTRSLGPAVMHEVPALWMPDSTSERCHPAPWMCAMRSLHQFSAGFHRLNYSSMAPGRRTPRLLLLAAVLPQLSSSPLPIEVQK